MAKGEHTLWHRRAVTGGNGVLKWRPNGALPRILLLSNASEARSAHECNSLREHGHSNNKKLDMNKHWPAPFTSHDWPLSQQHFVRLDANNLHTDSLLDAAPIYHD